MLSKAFHEVTIIQRYRRTDTHLTPRILHNFRPAQKQARCQHLHSEHIVLGYSTVQATRLLDLYEGVATLDGRALVLCLLSAMAYA